MTFDEQYPHAPMLVEMPGRPGLMKTIAECQCACGRKTRWIDVLMSAAVCSEGCLEKLYPQAARDFDENSCGGVTF